MLLFEETKQEADRDRFDLRLPELGDQLRYFLRIEWFQYLAIRRYAFIHSETQFVRNDWRRLHGIEIVQFGTCLSSHCEYVFKAFGGNQCSARAASLKQSVRADGGTVDNFDGFER